MEIKKIKISFLIFAGLVIAGFSISAIAQENSSTSNNIFEDSDQDGLSDDEEKVYGTDPNNIDTDGDGYSDGVEVESGYDPLKPAPGDRIINSPSSSEDGSLEEEGDDGVNLTEEVSLDIANMISSSDSDLQDITLDGLDSLVNEALNNQLTLDDLPEIDEDEIKIKKQNYDKYDEEEKLEREKEDSIEYLTAVSYLAINNLPYEISSEDDINGFVTEFLTQVELFSGSFSNSDYFEELANKAEDSMDQLYDIEVPENFLDLHIRGLRILKYAVSLKDQASPDLNDPVKAMANLSKVEGLMIFLSDFAQDVEEEVVKLGIQDLPLGLIEEIK